MRSSTLLTLLLLCSGLSAAQETVSLPFALGERLTYRVKVAMMGASGRATMWIDGPVDIRGTSVMVLHSESKAGFGPFIGSDKSTSWFDAARLASLRFVQYERHVVSKGHDSVEMNLEGRRWTAADGRSGVSPTDEPLDALSFIYYLRTLPLDNDSLQSFTRHFDADRSPTTIRVTGRDTITTPAGRFATVTVEMRVRDRKHYAGEGVIKLELSDDHRRIPVRIESRVPVVGTTVMTLESVFPLQMAACTRTPIAEPPLLNGKSCDANFKSQHNAVARASLKNGEQKQ